MVTVSSNNYTKIVMRIVDGRYDVKFPKACCYCANREAELLDYLFTENTKKGSKTLRIPYCRTHIDEMARYQSIKNTTWVICVVVVSIITLFLFGTLFPTSWVICSVIAFIPVLVIATFLAVMIATIIPRYIPSLKSLNDLQGSMLGIRITRDTASIQFEFANSEYANLFRVENLLAIAGNVRTVSEPKPVVTFPDKPEIKVGMSRADVIRLLGQPRDEGVSGSDLLGSGGSSPLSADEFLYFDKSPASDYSIRFSQGKVMSIQTYPKGATTVPKAQPKPEVKTVGYDTSTSSVQTPQKAETFDIGNPINVISDSSKIEIGEATIVLLYPNGHESQLERQLRLLRDYSAANIIPNVDVISLVALSSDNPHTRIVLITGSRSEYDAYLKMFFLPKAEEIFHALFHSDDWDIINPIKNLTNIPTKGWSIPNLEPFNTKVGEITSGKYNIVEYLHRKS